MNPLFAKLFVTIFIMSDTGGVATTALATDMTMKQCQEMKADIMQNTRTELQMQGHTATVKAKADCLPMQGVTGMVPPPVAGIVQDFIRGFADGNRN